MSDRAQRHPNHSAAATAGTSERWRLRGAAACKVAATLYLKILLALMAGAPLMAKAAFPATPSLSIGACTGVSNCYGYYAQWWAPGVLHPTIDAACKAVFAAAGQAYARQGWRSMTWSVVNSTAFQPFCNVSGYSDGGVYAWNIGGSSLTPSGQPAYSCPESSDLSETSCQCRPGYLQNATNDGCYQAVVVDVLRIAKASPESCPRFGNPIYPLQGSKKELVDTGLSIGGLALNLTYDSTLEKAQAAMTLVPRALGRYWQSNLHRQVVKLPGGLGFNAFRGNGAVVTFRFQGGAYVGDGDTADQFSVVPGGFRYIDALRKTVESYDSQGRIISLSDAQGHALTFSYSSAATRVAPDRGYLIQVTDSTGRWIKFEYTLPAGSAPATDGRVARIVSGAGQATVIDYDANGNLRTLTWPDERTRQFLYERPLQPWALTGVVDENGTRYATFEYDPAGLAISTDYSGGVNRFSVAYVEPPKVAIRDVDDPAAQVTYRYHEWAVPDAISLTLPNGQAVQLNAGVLWGAPVLQSLSQPAGSGCLASASAFEYDANGNKVLVDDFHGSRACRAYDALNRETLRVEGLASTHSCADALSGVLALPAGARRIGTTWHADWHLPTRTEQPLRRTTTVYHGQPDPFNVNAIASCATAPNLPNGKPLPLICKEVEEALLANGGVDPATTPTARSYTYDASGRRLTSHDAGTLVETYAYYGSTAFQGASTPSSDPSFDLVSLLLHGDGPDGGTTFADSSPNPKPFVPVDDAKVSSAQAKHGGSSIVLDGAGDYLLTPYHPDFSFRSGDFTIETFVYKDANSTGGVKLWGPEGDYYDGVVLQMDANGNLGVYVSTTGNSWTFLRPVVANLANQQWHHVAVTRSGGAIYAFVNGNAYLVAIGLGSAELYTNEARARVIGGQAGADKSLKGHIDEFRITRGVARYTANFTPPTTEFANNGPLMSAEDIGHAMGDLQTITNAAGHVTQFTQYDRAGRVRQMIDPKGVVTDITYTPRGWVSTVTTTAPGAAARTTSYTYDGVGQLTGVAHPDGSSLSYSYDAAHRLVGVTDAKGNSISYTLDNAGNKVSEEIKDPNGILQRSISRSYDALNRVQQVTGVAQ